MKLFAKRVRGAKPRQGQRRRSQPESVVDRPREGDKAAGFTRPGGRRQTSPEISTLAAKVLKGYTPTVEELKTMAASLLIQDETRGQK